MQNILLLYFCLFLTANAGAQQKHTDTLPVKVDLSRFHNNKKVVKAELWKAVIYFNQHDYLGKELREDTIRITPKYLEESVVNKLLEKGRARIFRRETGEWVKGIVHQLHTAYSLGIRRFEFMDGDPFFSQVEYRYSIMWNFNIGDSAKTETIKKKEVQVKDFAAPEEYPDLTDTALLRIRDYYPLVEGRNYISRVPDNIFGETDTTKCRVTNLQGREVYYFAECYSRYDLYAIDITQFGEGLYYYRYDSLFTIEADYEKDIQEKELQDAVLLLPAVMKAGDSTVSDNIFRRRVITMLRKEEIKAGNKLYNDCIKLKILDYYPGTVYIEYVWLCRNIGQVKWMRGTGRVDEVVNWFDGNN